MLYIGEGMKYAYKNRVHFSKDTLVLMHASHIVPQGSPLLVGDSGHMM